MEFLVIFDLFQHRTNSIKESESPKNKTLTSLYGGRILDIQKLAFSIQVLP